MENYELLKKGSTLRVTGKILYPSGKKIESVEGVYIGLVDKGNHYERIKLLCPIHYDIIDASDNILTIDTSDILDIQPTTFSKDVSSVLKIVWGLLNEQDKICSKINTLEDNLRLLRKEFDKKHNEVVQVFAKESQDLRVWKQKININLASLNCYQSIDKRKIIYVECLTKEKLLVELSFIRYEQVLSKRCHEDEEVTDKMIKLYTPEKQFSVQTYLPNAKILKVEKRYEDGDKGFVEFCQTFILEFDFDRDHYEEWLQNFKSSFALL